jgi:integrase
LDRVARRAGWKDGEIRTRPFRVTYATARLQTLDQGAPVSPWTVEKELGHGSRDMLEEVYGRLGSVRHRSEVMEFRVEQHFDWKGGEWVPKPRGQRLELRSGEVTQEVGSAPFFGTIAVSQP